jgi:hypothetical protein
MKTKEELKEWVKNLPQKEKATMMFIIKKNQQKPNESK